MGTHTPTSRLPQMRHQPRPSSEVDVGQVLDEGNWGGYQKCLILLTALTIVFDGIDNQLLGVAIPSIMQDGGFGYFGPQVLGGLRDYTGAFAAGFFWVAMADLLTFILIVTLYRPAWNRQRAADAPRPGTPRPSGA